MTIDIHGVSLENRISPKIIFAALVILHLALSFAVDLLPYSDAIVSGTVLRFLGLFALSAAGWYLAGWKELLGRWFALLLLTLGLASTALSLGTAGVMPWMALVPVVAVSVISFPAAVLAAIVSSAMIIALGSALGSDPLEMGASLLLVWAVLSAFYAAMQPLHERVAWLHQYFEEVRLELKEVRDRRAAYEQALEDLTHANRQMVLMNQRMAGLRQIAEEAQRAKTRFVARVSHEFRTPLNMIIGLVELMVTSPEIYDVIPSPRMREALRVVYRNCEHLSDMVDDVLDLTRIEMDRMALHKERVDLTEIVGSVIEAVSPLLVDKCLGLQTYVPSELPLVYCDPTRIEQVILNLLSNAVRHTDEGRITVRVAYDQQRVRLSVADTGSGIRPEDVDRIFEPFCQGTAELWRDRGGSGLGLSISKQFVELHGGRMWVESEFNVGTTFFFDLPVNPGLGVTARPGHQIREDWVWRERRSRPSFPESHYNPRFLVCDDTGDLEPFLASWADKAEFVPVLDLAQALSALKEEPAHAVLLNARNLQHLWEQIEMIRPTTSAMPLIGCSITRNDGRARSLGVLAHLVKPVRRRNLVAALDTLDTPLRRVLIVDDDPDALQLFREMLLAYDSSLEIAEAVDGLAALEQLQRSKPDVILLDLVMPGVDGWQVLETINSDEDIPRVPTLLISAQDPRDQLTRSDFLVLSTREGLSFNSVIELSFRALELLTGADQISDPASQ